MRDSDDGDNRSELSDLFDRTPRCGPPTPYGAPGIMLITLQCTHDTYTSLRAEARAALTGDRALSRAANTRRIRDHCHPALHWPAYPARKTA